MVSSRLRRFEERKAQKRITIAVIGSIATLAFVAIFGLKLLVGFSLLVDRMRGTSPTTQQQETVVLAPFLDPLPEATNSATITVSGKASGETTIKIFVDDSEYKEVTSEKDGTFSLSGIAVEEGAVKVSAKAVDAKGNLSTASNAIRTTVDWEKPKLIVDSPEDHASINDGTHRVTVAGLTDENTRLTINGRIVVVKHDGSFSYAMPVNDGENILTIIARDPAGNEETTIRTITYVP